MKRKRPSKILEQEEVVIVSDNEEDANADLSMAILAKASNKHPLSSVVLSDNGQQSASLSVQSLPSPVSPTVLELSTQQPLPIKKQKRKIKKKQAKSFDIRAEEIRSGKDIESTLIKIIGDDEEDNLQLRQLLRGPRYFDPQDALCFRCGNTGHFAGSCTEEARKKACFVCGSLDHEVKDCPQSCCLICQGTGHFSKACPNKGTHYNRLRERGNFCLRCGNMGHEMSLCDREYESEDLQMIQCYVCRKYGHLCCVDVALTSERQDTCYNCGDVGHTGVGCAKIRGVVECDRKTETVCYRCGETGHFARGCRKRDEDDFWDDFGTPRVRVQLPRDDFQGFRSVPAVVGAQKHRQNFEFYERSLNTSPVRWPEHWKMEKRERWTGSGWKHEHHRRKESKYLEADDEYNTTVSTWGGQTLNEKGKHNKAHRHVEARKSYSSGKRFWRKHHYH